MQIPIDTKRLKTFEDPKIRTNKEGILANMITLEFMEMIF